MGIYIDFDKFDSKSKADEDYYRRLCAHEYYHVIQAGNNSYLSRFLWGDSYLKSTFDVNYTSYTIQKDESFQALIEGAAEINGSQVGTGKYANYRQFYKDLKTWSYNFNKNNPKSTTNATTLFKSAYKGNYCSFIKLKKLYSEYGDSSGLYYLSDKKWTRSMNWKAINS